MGDIELFETLQTWRFVKLGLPMQNCPTEPLDAPQTFSKSTTKPSN